MSKMASTTDMVRYLNDQALPHSHNVLIQKLFASYEEGTLHLITDDEIIQLDDIYHEYIERT